MPLGPFRVEYIRTDESIPQKVGYARKALLLNAPKRQYLFSVAGVSFRQLNLEYARQLLANKGKYEKRAELIYENDNQHDPQAVAVYIFGKQVGYLPKGMCAEYREALLPVIPVGVSHIPMFCPFILVGGGIGLHIGVRLSLPRSLRVAVSRTRKAKVGKPKKRAVEYDPKQFDTV